MAAVIDLFFSVFLSVIMNSNFRIIFLLISKEIINDSKNGTLIPGTVRKLKNIRLTMPKFCTSARRHIIQNSTEVRGNTTLTP